MSAPIVADAELRSTMRLLRQHTIGDMLRRTASRYPDKVGISYRDTTWTYKEFDDICSRLAAGLAKLGVVAGDRVAILSRNSHGFAAFRYAVARVGAALVPINFMLNAEEARFILRSSGAKILAIGSDLVMLGQAAAFSDTAVETTVWLPGDDNLATAPGGMIGFDELLVDQKGTEIPSLESGMLAQIIYTSGTESRPKGAMLTHEAVMWQYATCVIEAEIAAADVILHALPLCHCAQLDAFLGPAIYVGATNVITCQPRADVILPLIAEHRINSFFAPTSIWISLLRSPLLDTVDVSSLEKGYYGASIMPVEVLREIQQRLPGLRLWNLYGQTEMAPVATVLRPEDQIRKAGSAGKPGLNVETRIVNDQMEDVPVGEVGEIVHRSPQLLSGYFNEPDMSAAVVRGGWFHSGDLGTADDEGYITIVDRKKDMIKTGGENVASREVEEAIYRLAEVSEVVVIGLPDPYWIEAVTAIVVVKKGMSLDENSVINHCRECLAHFKVPKRIIFVDLLPKTASAKVLKRDLRIQYSR
jgi:fatty-acyl-CoA synthase